MALTHSDDSGLRLPPALAPVQVQLSAHCMHSDHSTVQARGSACTAQGTQQQEERNRRCLRTLLPHGCVTTLSRARSEPMLGMLQVLIVPLLHYRCDRGTMAAEAERLR